MAATLDGGAWLRNPTVVKAALGALRQMSSSDAVKTLLADRGGIDKVRGKTSRVAVVATPLDPGKGALWGLPFNRDRSP